MLRLVRHAFPVAIAVTMALGQSQTPAPTSGQKPDDKNGKKSSSVITLDDDSSKSQPIPDAISLPDLTKRQPMDEVTKMQLVQLFNAEMVRIRKTLPVGNRNITISPDAAVRPGDARLHQLTE